MICSRHHPLSPALQWPESDDGPSSKLPCQITFGSVAAKTGSVALPARNTTAAAASWESFMATSPWLAASRNDGCSVFRPANEGDVPPLPFLISCRRGSSACLSGERGQMPPFCLRPRTRGAGRATCGGSPSGNALRENQRSTALAATAVLLSGRVSKPKSDRSPYGRRRCGEALLNEWKCALAYERSTSVRAVPLCSSNTAKGVPRERALYALLTLLTGLCQLVDRFAGRLLGCRRVHIF